MGPVERMPSLFEAEGAAPEGLAAARTPADAALRAARLGQHHPRGRDARQLVRRRAPGAVRHRRLGGTGAAGADRVGTVRAVLQHGDRDDAGHMAAYEGAVGILAPYAAALEQPGRPDWMRDKTFHAGGRRRASPPSIGKAEARAALGLDR